ncbi:hypothetical protein [Stutzerimonas kirkiae]|uniref:hypothetical protein n=1 Tax=Stutzerimonas kirkiae TaxID=2211392 RepID=UPI00103858BA|nr:hypothetical protein [Stutzerimonas kirkiae]
MQYVERLNRQAGSLAAVESSFGLLVEHLARAGALNKAAFIADLQRLTDLPEKEPETLLAERRILRLLRQLPS